MTETGFKIFYISLREYVKPIHKCGKRDKGVINLPESVKLCEKEVIRRDATLQSDDQKSIIGVTPTVTIYYSLCSPQDPSMWMMIKIIDKVNSTNSEWRGYTTDESE